jgi:hypothetical protein
LISALASARFLAAQGKRDEAIEVLVADRSMEAIRELDLLDAVDALAAIATRTDRPYTAAKALARRRRFDLLRPLLVTTPSTYLQYRFVAPGVSGALAGLWAAGAVADDSVLVRDWLVPATEGAGPAWHARSECAQLLALVGDIAMARAISKELRAAIAGTESERIERMAQLAPVMKALGGGNDCVTLLSDAQRLYDEEYAEDPDDYGIPFQDAILHAHAVVTHLERLVNNRALPWRPAAIVSSRFVGTRRYGLHRERHELWSHQIDYAIECGDLAPAFRILDEVRRNDADHAPYALIQLASGVPRARIDAAIAARLAQAVDKRSRQAVIFALAEAGHIAQARELVADDVDLGPWRDALTADR